MVKNEPTPPRNGIFTAKNVGIDTVNDDVTISVTKAGNEAGSIYSDDKFTFGIYEAKMKISETKNVRFAFFLLDPKSNGGGTENEIDVIEIDVKTCSIIFFTFTCAKAFSTIHQDSMHLPLFSEEKDLKDFLGENPFDEFHKYSLFWSKNSIEFKIDDKVFATVTDSKVLKKVEKFSRMHLYVNSYAYDEDNSPTTDSSLLVDYVISGT